MIKVLRVLFLGAVGGVAAHFGWLHLQQPRTPEGLDAQLAWIQRDLQLTTEQYARLKAIHQQSNARLVALGSQVNRMRMELAAFEQQRKTTGEIDFLEFAQFVEERRAVDRECLQSTRQLVDASASLMTAQQRSRYLQILPLADRPPLGPASN
jgi:hypothetical protein